MRLVIDALIVCSIVGAAWLDVPVRAGGFKSPEECLAYMGDAHVNCL